MTRLTATSAFILSSPLRRPRQEPAEPRFAHGPPAKARPHPHPAASLRSAVGARAPEHIAGTAIIDPTTEHEKVVGKAVQVLKRFGIDRFSAGKFANQTLRPPDEGAREM